MIALLSASWDEISQLGKDIKVAEEGNSADLSYKIGELYDHSVIIVITGVGIKRARTAASFVIQRFKPDLIIFGGFGGALSPDLNVGDIVLGESVTSLKKNGAQVLYSYFSIPGNDYKKGSLLTEGRFINEPKEKKRLFDSTGALVVDMETWGVVEAAQQTGTPVASVRVVSDEAHERLPDMTAIYGREGKIDFVKAEAYFKSAPELLSPYLQFRLSNSHKASDSLCKFLRSLVCDL